jgi:hypothetical protein
MKPRKRKKKELVLPVLDETDLRSLYIFAKRDGVEGGVKLTSVGRIWAMSRHRDYANELLWEIENALAKNERLTRKRKKA